jgi:hypothetical protein
VAIGVHVVVSYFFWTPVHVSRARLLALAHARVGGLFGAFDGEILSPMRNWTAPLFILGKMVAPGIRTCGDGSLPSVKSGAVQVSKE